MARGGFRPGAGRPKGSGKPAGKAPRDPAAAPSPTPKDGVLPLDYMLAVMADEGADAARRDRMAIAAAPFMHPRVADQARGKKDQQADRAKDAAGKFKTRPAPLKLVRSG